MLKRILFAAMFLMMAMVTTRAYAVPPTGQGVFVVNSCSSIVSPVTNGTWCLTPGPPPLVSVWNGSSYVPASGSTPINSAPAQTGSYNAQGFSFFNLPVATASPSGQPLIYGQSGAVLTSLTASVNGVLNVMAPPYNAKGDGVTDDLTAIQNAIYDACNVPNRTPVVGTQYSAVRAVYLPLPSVCYAISKPLRDICGHLALFSDKDQIGGLCPTFSGPSIIKSNQIGTLLYSTSLVTGPGNSLVSANSPTPSELIDVARWTANNGTINFNYIFSGPYGGVNLAFFMKATAAGSHIIESKPAYPGTGNGAFVFGFNGSSEVTLSIETTGGQLTFTPCPAQTLSNVYEIELDWDKSTYRLWQGTPGGTATLCGSQISSNPMIQSKYEEILLPDGGSTQVWPDNSSSQDNPFTGFLDSIRIEGLTVHTSAYTVPTTKFLPDSYTYFLTNFEASVDGTQIAYDQIGGGGNIYLPFVEGGYNISYTGGGYIHDIELCNNHNYTFTSVDGLYAQGGNGSKYKNLSCANAGYVAFDFHANEYWDDIDGLVSYGGLVGTNMGPAFNSSSYEHSTIDGITGACWVGAGGGLSTIKDIRCNDRGSLDYAFIQWESAAHIDNFSLDQELLDTAFNGVLINSPTGTDLITSSNLTGPVGGPFIRQDGGGYGLDIQGSSFTTGFGSPNYLIDFTNGTPTTQAQLTGITNASSIALSNLPEWVQSNNVSFVTNTQMQTITCNSALDGQTFGFLVKDATTCTTGSAITGSGSTYCTAICNGATGWVH